MPNKIKPKRSYTANAVPVVSGGTPDIERNEIAINWADSKLYTRNNSDQLVSITLGGGGGGSANIVEAATAGGFPATGAANTIYIATEASRAYRWSGSVYVEVGPSGGGGGSGDGADAVLRALFVPAVPTSVTATAGNAQVALSWTAPSVLAQTPITDYTVQFSSDSGLTWTTFADGTSTATSTTVTGLTNGTAYVFRVAGANGVGTGAYSTASASVTPTAATFRAIPAMTSNTAPSGVVTGVTNRGGDSDAWKAFDGSSESGSWVYLARAGSNDPRRMLQYAFPDGEKSRISGYSISLDGPADLSSIPYQWGFYGSDDLTNWTQIETRTDSARSSGSWFGTGITAGQARTFTLPSVVIYRAYRWVFEETDAGQVDSIGLREISLVQ
jgi:hypothetical protein